MAVLTVRRIRVITVAMHKRQVITNSECVFLPLVILHAKHTCRIISVPSQVVPYFATLSHKQQDFRKMNKDGVFSFFLQPSQKHSSLYDESSQMLS
jgi:hypothetical protein